MRKSRPVLSALEHLVFIEVTRALLMHTRLQHMISYYILHAAQQQVSHVYAPKHSTVG